jgi:hypothetical protein
VLSGLQGALVERRFAYYYDTSFSNLRVDSSYTKVIIIKLLCHISGIVDAQYFSNILGKKPRFLDCT